MGSEKAVGGIIEKALREIIAEKGYLEEEAERMLSKSLNLVGLAMAGFRSASSSTDRRRVEEIIED
ncbi:MAG: hypothetical protein ACYCR2_05760 [Thermoplasmataceae archaeon]